MSARRLWPLLIFAAAFVAYFPALSGALLWNDRDYITAPALQSIHGLHRIWFELNATEQYYPVLHSAFWIEHRLWADGALGYHLATLALHVLSACLLVLVLCELRLRGALFAGLLFALHPLAVESVAWLSEQKNTLSTCLLLVAALAFLRWDARRTRLGYALATLAFVLALLSKSTTAVLPGCLLLLAWWRGSLRRQLAPLSPWLLLGALAGLFTGWVEREYLGATGPDFALNLLQRAVVAGRASAFYVGKFFAPFPLCFFYPRWRVPVHPGALLLWPLGTLLLVVALARLRGRAPLTIALLTLLCLFPTLGFLNVYAFVFSFVADHWAYLALLVASGALAPWAARFPRAAGALLAILGALTWQRCHAYRDDETLYRDTLRKNPGSAVAHHNLGVLLETSGRPEAALAEFQAAIEAQPKFPDAYNDWGLALADLGRTDDAGARYRTALAQRPEFPQAENNLASLLLSHGQIPEARSLLEDALRLNPRFASAENNLGIALASQGAFPEAVGHYRRALALAPGFADAHNNLGVALAALGQPQSALAEYESALRFEPRFAEAETNLGNALQDVGRPADALPHYRRAIAIAPDYAPAHFNTGLALRALNRADEAAAEWAVAVRLDPSLRRRLPR